MVMKIEEVKSNLKKELNELNYFDITEELTRQKVKQTGEKIALGFYLNSKDKPVVNLVGFKQDIVEEFKYQCNREYFQVLSSMFRAKGSGPVADYIIFMSQKILSQVIKSSEEW